MINYLLYGSISIIVLGSSYIAWSKGWIQAAWHLIFPEALPGIACKTLARVGLECRLLPARLETPLHAVIEIEGVKHYQNAGKVSYTWIDGTKHSYVADLDNPLGKDEDGHSIYPHNVGSVYAANVSPEFISSQFFNELLELKVARDFGDYLEDLREKTNIPWMKYLLWAGIVIGVIFLWKSGILTQLYNEVVPDAAPPAQTQPAPTQPGPSIVIPKRD